MIRTLAAAALATSLVSGSALAQEKLFRTVKATPGQQMPLGQVGLIKRDCSVGPLPDIRVLTPPKQGTLAIRERTTKAGDIKRCPKLETTVRGVLYRANAGTSGTDEVVYEVKRADGSIQSMTVRIEIGTGPAAGGASQDAADL